jgi:uncharacterized membrane-anchored protein YhcB (DUF1043 family)
MLKTGERLMKIESDLEHIRQQLDEQKIELKEIKNIMTCNTKNCAGQFADKKIENWVYAGIGLILTIIATYAMSILLKGGN